MKLIGLNFDKILIERKNPIKDKLEIKNNINITSISQEKLDIIKNETVLKFEFEYKIDYTPNIAEIEIKGAILVIFDKDHSKEILKKWKSKKISDEIRVPLFNLILAKCNIKALILGDEFNLPPHIPLPKVSVKNPDKDKTNYTG